MEAIPWEFESPPRHIFKIITQTKMLKKPRVILETFSLNVFVTWTFIHFLKTHYLIATTIGFGTQTMLDFFINRIWTFHEPKLDTVRGLLTTSIIQLSSLGIGLIGISIGIEILGWSFIFAKILSGVIVGIFAYAMDSRFTFHFSLFK